MNRGAQLDAAALGGMEPLTLTGIFHTAKRRVRARGLQEPSEVLAGRVPSRGAVSALPSECEICGLTPSPLRGARELAKRMVMASRCALNRARQILRLWPVLLGAGCASHSFDATHIADVRYKPSNVYLRSKILDPQIKRVALLPITTVSSTETFTAGAQLLQPLVGAELEKAKRFELVIISPEELRQWTGQRAWREDEALPPDFFSRLREGCGCDAVFFTQLTRYYPYQPVAVGWKLSLVEVQGRQIVWKADELFDAGDTIVANAARHYSGEHVHIEGPADDPAAILGSPSRFGQYSLSAILATLPTLPER